MKRIPLLVLACLSLTACGPSQEMIQMQSQVDKLQPQQADMSATLNQLRQEIDSLRGELDDARRAAEEMKCASDAVGGFGGLDTKIADHQRMLDRILSELSMERPGDDAAAVGTMAGTATAGGATIVAAAIPSASAVLGQQDAATVTPTEKTAKTSSVTSTATPKPTGDAAETAKLLYNQGYAYYTRNKFKEALASFDDFIKTYPESDRIASAWFWKGQSCFALKRYSAAVLAYETVISKYPNSNKIPLAYLRQGMGFSRLGNADAAKIRLNGLIQMFPASPEAKRAKTFLASMK